MVRIPDSTHSAVEALHSTLSTLSLPAAAQIAAIPTGRCIPCTLAQMFTWWSREFRDELTTGAALTEVQLQALERVAEASEEAARSHQCHDNEAVHSGAAFVALREVAAAALAEFGYEPCSPDRRYIPGTPEHAARCEQAERERKKNQRTRPQSPEAKLRFHRAMYAAIGASPVVSKGNVQVLRKRERVLGVRFPAAVFELLSLEGAAELFREHSNADELVTNDELDDAKKLEQFGAPAEIRQGYLRVAVENQGVVAFYVPLDGSDDPPVFHNNDQWDDDLKSIEWVKVSDSFSRFVCAMMGVES